MQAIIMAAGRGSRIAKYSNTKPKSLLEIGGTSILRWQVELFHKYGIKDIVVVVGYKHELLRDALKEWKITFVYNPFYSLMNVLGSFWFALSELRGDFIFVHADTIFEEEILKRILAKEGEIVLAADKKQCGQEEMKYRLNGDKLIEINKIMDPQTAEGEFIGMAKFGKKAVPFVKSSTENLIEEGNFNLFFEAVIQKIVDSQAVSVEVADVSGLKWNEIDTEQDYEDALKLFAKDNL